MKTKQKARLFRLYKKGLSPNGMRILYGSIYNLPKKIRRAYRKGERNKLEPFAIERARKAAQKAGSCEALKEINRLWENYYSDDSSVC